MKKRYSTAQTIPAFLAVLLLLFTSSSHIHIRYCLDGEEAPVSIHFETDDSHPSDIDFVDGIAESDQADVESELSLDTLRDKSSKVSIDIDVVTLSSIYPLAAVTKSLNFFLFRESETLPSNPATLLPPSRAPPAIA